MKEINIYSAQYKRISEKPAQLCNQNQSQNHPNTAKLAPHEYAKKRKQLSKQNQEFINKCLLVDLNNFILNATLEKKTFFSNKWIYKTL